MSTALSEPDRYFTREEYRRWCEEQPRGRYERVEGHVVAMAPKRGAHLRVKANVWLALRRAIIDAGVACQSLPDGATVEIGENDYEPDALVNCGEPMGDNEIAAPNPVVVVEVLSPGTRAVDTGRKLGDYFKVPSVTHYLMVDPVRPRIIHHQRAGDAITTRIIGSGRIAMDPPGITISVEEIYEAG